MDHPYVSDDLLREMHRINPRYRLAWELQLNDEFRWHVYMHRTDGGDDQATHVMLIADDEDLEFRPFDGRAIARLRNISLWSTDPVRWVKIWQEEEEKAREKLDAGEDDSGEQYAKYYRRLFARLATNDKIPYSYWAGGIDKKEDGTYIVEPTATPKRREITTVVAGEKRL